MFSLLSWLTRQTPPPLITSELIELINTSPQTLLWDIDDNKITSDFISSAKSSKGQTLLHLTIFYANRHKHNTDDYQVYHLLFATLLEQGADLNARDNGGYTPFMYAVRFLLTDMVETSLEHGALLTMTSSKGKTPRMMLDEYKDNLRVCELKALLDGYHDKVNASLI